MARNDIDRRIGNKHGFKVVLLTRFSALGDVAMTIPVVYSACACYPDVKFVMATRKSMVGIFVNHPANLEVVGLDLKEYKGASGLWRLCRYLVGTYHVEAYIDLHDVLRTKLLRTFARLRGVRTWALNKGRRHRRALTRRTNKVMLPLLGMRARYREAFFQAGLPVEMCFEGLFGAGRRGDVADFAAIPGTEQRHPQEKWIGIAPFAAHPGKVYPLDKMEKVVKSIDARGDCRIFIFGAGDEESRIAHQWADKYHSVTPLAGKRYGFKAELALLSHLDAMLSMDSANMHLASIAGARTVSVWGATHYYCGFKGWHQRESDMVQLPLSCRPCSVFGDKPCFRHDMLCMSAIRPEHIVKKIDAILGEEPEKEESKP